MIRALIVDDEELACEELQLLLEETGAFELVGVCFNALDALKQIKEKRPELLFLDIEMPQINGFELLAMIEADLMPHVVFVTAYDEHALKAFEEKTLDYLLKPVSRERMDKTVAKLRETIRRGQVPSYEVDSLKQIPCQQSNRVKLIATGDVEFAFSDLAGIHVVSPEGMYFTELTLKALEEKTELLRCHRKYLINPAKIDQIKMLENGLAEIITFRNAKIPVSRRYLRQLKAKLEL
ncbi:two component transcriptional regulator, LytTR family [Malonomonas rubra DSM 5091]|uniref:Two component transcriptional regulator, LytTR family n=1 Tax=Malonomonas rubra DSM 5091 TaxID=1122189 RepID=A0A1M6GKG2_MALRU|nr:two-component system response regulator BtsR [Malonomonas rubra]SHJ10431.1 two component transcriptional regulator, LytTR family [Malonomonas rubra DSM 5091]